MLKYSLPFALLIFGALGSAAQTPPVGTFNGPGRYEIENVESGLLLDVAAEDHQTVQQYPRRGRLNQLWDIQPAANGYFTLQSADQEKLLSLERRAAREGVGIVVSPRDGGENQLWQIVALAPGEFQIVSKFGGALDVPHRSHEKGTRLQSWTRTGDENQRFRLIFVSSAAASWDAGNYRGGPSSRRHDMDSDDATQACRTEVSRQIVDVRAREIFLDLVSTDSEGNAIVLWKTPRNSSGFCRVDRAGRVTQFKVQEVSR